MLLPPALGVVLRRGLGLVSSSGMEPCFSVAGFRGLGFRVKDLRLRV